MLPLAQLPAEVSSPLVQFLLGGSAAIFALNQVITFWKDHMRERPTPADTYATKAEFEAHVAAVEERFEKLNEDRRRNVALLHEKMDELAKTTATASEALRREIKADVETIHGRIAEQMKEVAKLTGALSTALKNSNHPFSR